METQNYTLEKHLEILCNDDHDYKDLYAVWQLNKKNLSQALSTITSDFPFYSIHDASHSSKVVDNIQRLLGRDRIERLGATDTFLLLMAALTHDVGMCLSYGILEKEWNKEEFADTLQNYSTSPDKQIAAAAQLLMNYHAKGGEKKQDNYLWALEIRNAVTLITTHMMRKGHEGRGASFLEGDNEFSILANGFHSETIPSRFITLLSKVAYLHGADFQEVLTSLRHKADGYKGDYIHPRFIACMIRMGDLLDVDSNRFNLFAMSKVKQIPDTTVAHFEKHQAVKHLLISPTGIEAELDCTSDRAYRLARELFDMLESEVEKQRREWNRVAPSNLGGLPPVLHKDSILILYKGVKTRPELMNLRFSISSSKVFEMLKGGAIYTNPGQAFIREIVQNALDASKLQLWKDLKYYHDDIGKIRFSCDIEQKIYKKYPVHLSVDWEDETTKDAIIVTCEDWGTGISEENLIRMTSKVGESRKADKDYLKTIAEMPYWLQPTAAFGLGLQTIFYVANEFTVQTSCPGEPSRQIVFRTSENGSYCSIEDEGIDMHQGTRLTIRIQKNHFEKLFEWSDEEMSEISLSPESLDYQLSKIDSYVQKNFRKTENFPLQYTSHFLNFGSEKASHIEEKNKKETKGDYIISSSHDFYGRLLFHIEEKKYGSMLDVAFSTSEPYTRVLLSNYLSLRDVRIDHMVEFPGSRFISINWNLFCRTADSLVTISRDNLLPNGKNWCKRIIMELLPDILQMTYDIIKKELQDDGKDAKQKDLLLQQLFSLCIVDRLMPKQTVKDYSPLESINLPDDEICSSKGNTVNGKQFLSANNYFISESFEDKSTKRIINKIKKEPFPVNDAILILGISDLKEVIPNQYNCCEILQFGKEIIFNVKKRSSEKPQLVKLPDGYLVDLMQWSPSALHGFEKYKEIVVSDAPLLDAEIPEYGDCWIYRPNTSNIRIIQYQSRSKDEAKKKIKEMIQQLVPDRCVSLIQKYNVLKNDNITPEQIYSVYIKLITDNYSKKIK